MNNRVVNCPNQQFARALSENDQHSACFAQSYCRAWLYIARTNVDDKCYIICRHPSVADFRPHDLRSVFFWMESRGT